MKYKSLFVIFDQPQNNVLISLSKDSIENPSLVNREGIIDDMLNHMHIQNNDVNLIHLMSIENHISEEIIDTYIGCLKERDCLGNARNGYLWIPVQYLSICGILGSFSGFDRFLVDYAVETGRTILGNMQ